MILGFVINSQQLTHELQFWAEYLAERESSSWVVVKKSSTEMSIGSWADAPAHSIWVGSQMRVVGKKPLVSQVRKTWPFVFEVVHFLSAANGFLFQLINLVSQNINGWSWSGVVCPLNSVHITRISMFRMKEFNMTIRMASLVISVTMKQTNNPWSWQIKLLQFAAWSI